MKKLIFLFIIMFSLTNCASFEMLSGYSIILPKNKEEDLDKLIEFYGDIENTSDENSYLKEIKLLEKITNPVKGIKLLEAEIVIETNKKYILKNIDKSNYIKVYNQGVKINSDTFTIYIGKIQLENGKIINIPPLKFKRYVQVYSINKILDTLNQDTKKLLFNGTIVGGNMK
ncbi:hypothetical protein YWH7199_09310 [Fusobacterium nucleatum YWH7199]|uniref:hypothetical protein n=1 Tax=Fusobacterium nucleatum TaxID=851 RepID=UPI00201AF86F|nr:hypothetical protein [Fusobacterium nucleatum]MCL4581558.1 hypothetical protein [Fusobacterium nucleatum YWH7199]